ncbi:DegT/DnrJ/EryC1/StrS family aminotransferase [Nitrospirillum iridis]|uniref:dTDP-4-amino-4,6-dideoxygalactose transaminase n=1 Tax=Nitrospirillum iridis TaxID=765888 RepID=A0A7X0ECZ3_9PROT|nr:DegT/DnrJ/EryC1/StrS family aminotransferase [Nitrospirillum iridis]MBB6252267.1 dTDP-4-amino-4,6-dideoxygalactose transaminase [Nitrospirillum iridis]
MAGLRRVRYADFAAQYAAEREALLAAMDGVLARGDFIGGADVSALEEELALLCGVPHVVAMNSGTDPLWLALKCLGVGPGDEVITASNSFVASAAAIAHLGAVPVFADVGSDQLLDAESVARAVTARTKAIMPVHLTGRICDMDALRAVADAHGLKVVEDAAQSIGSLYKGRSSGSLGDAAGFSLHPLKNLNAVGDAGFLATGDGDLAERVRRLRNHGLANRDVVVEFGYNSRLDTLQAAVLRTRLPLLPGVIEARRRNAALYRRLLDPAHIYNAPCRDHEFNTFHLFVIQVDRRDALQSHLADHGIGSKVHYPIPIHQQPAAAPYRDRSGPLPLTEQQAARILSLPIHQYLTPADIAYVADVVNAFYR